MTPISANLFYIKYKYIIAIYFDNVKDSKTVNFFTGRKILMENKDKITLIPELNHKIDYLAVSICPANDVLIDTQKSKEEITKHVDDYVDSVLAFFGFDRSFFGDAEKSNEFGGYDRKLVCGSIKFSYRSCLDDESNKPACRMELTGKGVDEYDNFIVDNSHKPMDWIKLLNELTTSKDFRINITRIDVAMDAINMMSVPKPYIIERNYVRKTAVLTTAKHGVYIHSDNYHFDTENEIAGSTVYFGNPKSDQRLRIYDKLEEMKVRKTETKANIQKWIRFELQLRREKAMEFAKMCVERESIRKTFQSALAGHYRFYSKKNAERVRKLRKQHRAYDEIPVVKWYQEVLEGLEKSKIKCNKQDTSIYKTRKWLRWSTDCSRYKVNIYDRLIAEIEGRTGAVMKLVSEVPKITGATIAYNHFRFRKQDKKNSRFCNKFVHDICNSLISEHKISYDEFKFADIEKQIIDMVLDDSDTFYESYKKYNPDDLIEYGLATREDSMWWQTPQDESIEEDIAEDVSM